MLFFALSIGPQTLGSGEASSAAQSPSTQSTPQPPPLPVASAPLDPLVSAEEKLVLSHRLCTLVTRVILDQMNRLRIKASPLQLPDGPKVTAEAGAALAARVLEHVSTLPLVSSRIKADVLMYYHESMRLRVETDRLTPVNGLLEAVVDAWAKEERDVLPPFLPVLGELALVQSYQMRVSIPLVSQALQSPEYGARLYGLLSTYITGPRMLSKETAAPRRELALLHHLTRDAPESEGAKHILAAIWKDAIVFRITDLLRECAVSAEEAQTGDMMGPITQAFRLIHGLDAVFTRVKAMASASPLLAAVEGVGQQAFQTAYMHLPRPTQITLLESISMLLHVLLDAGHEQSRGLVMGSTAQSLEQARHVAITQAVSLVHYLTATEDLMPLYEARLAERLLSRQFVSLGEEADVLRRLDYGSAYARAGKMIQEMQNADITQVSTPVSFIFKRPLA